MNPPTGKSQADQFDAADREFMTKALHLAKRAEDAGEVPVGAVVIYQGRVVGEGWNAPIKRQDPTSHAEIEAIREAAIKLGNYRLMGTTLFCTLEPCVMCSGAIANARIDRLVFAARDLRFGAVRSKFALIDSSLLNHKTLVEEGLFAVEAGELMASFFRRTRTAGKVSTDTGSPAEA